MNVAKTTTKHILWSSFVSHRSFSKRPELDVEVLSELLVGWVELLCDEIPRVWAQRLVVHSYGDFCLEEALLRCDENVVSNQGLILGMNYSLH